ncbi:unnamed protein product, partial [Discosporangium mesarthrocarpum]
PATSFLSRDYVTVMHACLKAGAWERALSLFDELGEAGRSQGAPHGQRSRSQGQENGPHYQQEQGQECQQHQQQVLAGGGWGGSRREVAPVSETMSGLTSSGQEAWGPGYGPGHKGPGDVAGYPRNPAAYAAALRACGQGGAWLRAAELLDSMWAGGLTPEIRHYALAAAAAASVSLPSSLPPHSCARQEVHMMGRLPAEAGVSPAPGAAAHTGTVGARVEAGQLHRGEAGEEVAEERQRFSNGSSDAVSSLLFEMAGRGVTPEPEFYSALSWGWGRQGQWLMGSEGVLALMRKHGLPAGGSASASGGLEALYVRLLYACEQLGEEGEGKVALRALQAVLNDAREQLGQPHVSLGCNESVGGSKLRSSPTQVYRLGTDLVAAATRALSKLGDWKGALDLALEKWGSMGTEGGMVADSAAVGHAVSACARARKLEEVETLLQLLQRGRSGLEEGVAAGGGRGEG